MPVDYVDTKMPCLTEGQGRDLHDAMIKKYKLEGLCCSWAMDWVKKKLTKEHKLNAQTYESKARMKKIALRHRKQEKHGVEGVAKAYSLRLHERAYGVHWLGVFGDESELGNKELPPGRYYYISIADKRNENGHGFAMYSGSPILLADSYSGIYQCTGGTCVEVARDHATKVYSGMGRELGALNVFQVTTR